MHPNNFVTGPFSAFKSTFEGQSSRLMIASDSELDDFRYTALGSAVRLASHISPAENVAPELDCRELS